jgi:hypothetical protein
MATRTTRTMTRMTRSCGGYRSTTRRTTSSRSPCSSISIGMVTSRCCVSGLYWATSLPAARLVSFGQSGRSSRSPCSSTPTANPSPTRSTRCCHRPSDQTGQTTVSLLDDALCVLFRVLLVPAVAVRLHRDGHFEVLRLGVYYTPHYLQSLALLQYPDRQPQPDSVHPLLPPALRPDSSCSPLRWSSSSRSMPC